MSNPNQQQSQQQNKVVTPSDTRKAKQERDNQKVLCRVKIGKVLIAHGENGEEDTYAEVGDTFETTRGWYEKHVESRKFETYFLPEGGNMADRPHVANDLTVELVSA